MIIVNKKSKWIVMDDNQRTSFGSYKTKHEAINRYIEIEQRNDRSDGLKVRRRSDITVNVYVEG